ncbi:MAG: azurin [Pseudomonadales bacterium]|jgi:azurin|nr:azurin [Pseudomonadales bacterium]
MMHRFWKGFVLAAMVSALGACGGGESSDAAKPSSSASAAAPSAAEDAMADVTNEVVRMTGEARDSMQDMAADVSEEAGRMADEAQAAAGDMAASAQAKATEMATAAREEASKMASAAGGAAAAAMGAAAPAAAEGPCTVAVSVGDALAYDPTTIAVPSSCETVTIQLTHTGRLPKEAMGHNWVLVPTDAMQAVANAGIQAGIERNYTPDDDRIVAATRLVGGGDSASVTFELAALESGVAYSYLCTFPGHWTVMKGTFSVVDG